MSLVHPHSPLQKQIVATIDELIPQKNAFVSNDGLPCFDKNRKCFVPYNLTNPQDATICGTAFDYLARFLVAQKAKKFKTSALTDLVAGKLYANSSRWMSYGITRTCGLENYHKLLEKISDYIENDSLLLEDEVAELCILLAKMEQETRSKRSERPTFQITNTDQEMTHLF